MRRTLRRRRVARSAAPARRGCGRAGLTRARRTGPAGRVRRGTHAPGRHGGATQSGAAPARSRRGARRSLRAALDPRDDPALLVDWRQRNTKRLELALAENWHASCLADASTMRRWPADSKGSPSRNSGSTLVGSGITALICWLVAHGANARLGLADGRADARHKYRARREELCRSRSECR